MSSDEQEKVAPLSPRRVPSHRPGPKGGKRDQNRRRRTRELCLAGLELFLKRGLANVTVDEIAREANTAKGNFYRYLRDKTDLVEALLAPVVEGYDDAFAQCQTDIEAATDVSELTQAYTRLAIALMRTTLDNSDVVQLYLQEARGPAYGPRAPLAALERRMTERAIALTQLAHEHGLLSKIPARVSALVVMGATERLLLEQLRHGAFDNIPQTIQSLVRLVMEGIA